MFINETEVKPRRAVGVVVALLLIVSVMYGCAHALEPGWYAKDGEGILIGCNDYDECAVMWFTHDKSGDQLWLTNRNNCAQAESVCYVDLAVTSGTWRQDETVVDEASVFVTLVNTGTSLSVDYDARLLFPDECGVTSPVTPGGLIFRKCVGDAQFDLLAR